MIAPGLPFDSYLSDCEPKSGLVQSPGSVIALSDIAPLSALEPPAETAPSFLDNTADLDNSDYVSDWTDWEGVNFDLLLNIYKTELHNKWTYANSLSLRGA